MNRLQRSVLVVGALAFAAIGLAPPTQGGCRLTYIWALNQWCPVDLVALGVIWVAIVVVTIGLYLAARDIGKLRSSVPRAWRPWITWGIIVLAFTSALIVRDIRVQSHRPTIQTSLMGVSLGLDTAEVRFMKGEPLRTRVVRRARDASGEPDSVLVWTYRTDTVRCSEALYNISFVKESGEEYARRREACPESESDTRCAAWRLLGYWYLRAYRVSDIRYHGRAACSPEIEGFGVGNPFPLDETDGIAARFGEASEVLTSQDGLRRYYYFDKYHVFFGITLGDIYAVGVHDPSDSLRWVP